MYKELNKKLAEWVGNIKHSWDNEICGYRTTECFCWNCMRSEDYTPFPCVPDFTQSLDACFKWLVPKFPELQDLARTSKGWLVTYQSGKTPKLSIPVFDEVEAETPALALCLAVEKLIDGGKIECGN